jgi:mannose-1-phosphate guanylyltransferase
MKALILVGGLGTRLRPLTYTRPKPMLPIANRPHIEHVFDLLSRHDVTEAVLLTSYLAEAFDEVVAHASDNGLSVRIAREEEPLGTAGALKNAELFVGDHSFLAFNGDILTDLDLGALIDWHGERGAGGTIWLTPVEDPSAFGVVPTDDDGRVLDFIEKPERDQAPTNLINAGVYVLEPSVLKRIPTGAVWSAERQLFPQLVEEGVLFATAIDAYWMEIGNPEKYLRANLDAISGRYATDAVQAPAEDGVVLGKDASVATGARVSSACLGDRVVIEEGAVVERSVLLPDVTVKPGAVVADSVLGAGVTVRARTKVMGQTIADGESAG